uniref:Col_cuticle_N domain-containing protein n=1 Tax=Steinernema glaseri TaxID=37863 RepID=A0A1I8AM70_9BILA
MSLPPHNFNPNDRKFRSCCCHVKTFTIIFGVLEIFAICFLLVAVLPDVNTKVCSEMVSLNGTNATSEGNTE